MTKEDALRVAKEWSLRDGDERETLWPKEVDSLADLLLKTWEDGHQQGVKDVEGRYTRL